MCATWRLSPVLYRRGKGEAKRGQNFLHINNYFTLSGYRPTKPSLFLHYLKHVCVLQFRLFFTITITTLHYITTLQHYITTYYNKVHDRIGQYSTLQYITIQFNIVYYNSIQYSTLQYSTIQYYALPYSKIQYSTLQYITLPYKFTCVVIVSYYAFFTS